MKVIVTGASGFLGSKICKSIVANVITVGRSANNDIIADISVNIPNIPEEIDVVIHAAGKAHMVPHTEAEKKDFYTVNVNGTLNLLTALERSGPPKSFVFISSVSVYGLTQGNLITESAPLLATDAYGLSKIQAEHLVAAWCQKNNVTCTILRLPLLAGSDPPGNLGAMINGIRKGFYLNIAGGRAQKSMVLATDVACAIQKAAEVGGIYNLTDGGHPTFAQLSNLIASQLNVKQPMSIPYPVAKIMALAGDIIGSKSPINSGKLKKIMAHLTFDDARARDHIGWAPTQVLKGFKI